MKLLLIFIFTILIINGCQSSAENSFNTMLEKYHEEWLALNPLQATSAGDYRYNDKLPNYLTQQRKNDEKAFYSKYSNLLATYNRDDLSADDQMNYDVLKWECDINLSEPDFPDELMPVNQMWSFNLYFGQLAGGQSNHPFRNTKDYEDWLKRLDGYIAWCDTAYSNMQKGISKGYVIPRTLIIKTIPQWEALARGPVEDHLFYMPVKAMPDNISPADSERLSAAFKTVIENKILPLYHKISLFLKNEYLSAGIDASGYSAYEGGLQYYDYAIKYFTTTTMTADEIFDIGMAEVRRISDDMEAVKKEVGFNGDLKSFFNHVRSNPQLMPFEDAQQVIDNFNQIHERMKPYINQLFDLMPKTPFEVRRTETFREASASPEYNAGSMDGSRPGIFYVPVPNALKYNTFADENTFLHEAIPGHHFQISLQQENRNLAAFRRLIGYGAYTEGWALYTESLGKELGLYKDPYSWFGALNWDMHRALRLVIDVGLHVKGWSREQAIQFSLDYEAETEENIIREVERYMALPGQALSYKIGQLKIIELRKMAENELAEKFSIRQFHNQVLNSGSIPLYVLENKITRWVAEQKQL